MFYLSLLLFHINRNAKINKQTTEPAATTATTIRAVLSPSPLRAACSPGRPVIMSFSVDFPSTVTVPIPVVASVLLDVVSLVVVVVVGGLAVPRDVPRFVVVVVASVVAAAVVVGAVVVGAVVVPAVVGGAVVVVMVEAAVVAALVAVVRCVVIDRFTLVVEGGWVTFKERNDNRN